MSTQVSLAQLQAVAAGLPGNIPASNPGIQSLMALMQSAQAELQPYSFPVAFLNLIAGATAPPGSFFIDSSAPFLLISQQYVCVSGATLTGAQIIGPNIAVAIQDQQSNRNWQASSIPVSSVFGDGRLPYFLPQPRLIAANSTVVVTPNNYDTTTAYSFSLIFTGFRVYQ